MWFKVDNEDQEKHTQNGPIPCKVELFNERFVIGPLMDLIS